MASKKIADQLEQSVQVDAASVFGASVQLPMFDKAEPDAWFILAEANFNLRKVTDSSTKYWYVLSKFDAATLRKLSAFLKQPRGDDPYLELRNMLCETFEPPLEQKLDAFLALNNLGDDRPVELGLEIERLLAGASLEDIKKRVFVRSLPKSIVTAITASLEGKFKAVMAAADKAWTTAAASDESPSATVAAISGPPQRECGEIDKAAGNVGLTIQAGESRCCRCVNSTKDSETPRGNVNKDARGGTKTVSARFPAREFIRSRRHLTERTPTLARPRKTRRSVAERGRKF